MGGKAITFITGLIISSIVLFVAVIFLSRPAPEVAPPEEKVVSSADLSAAKAKTNGLENFGNLPFVITGDQIGRSNPFDPYK
jgi:hypothetical protein